jgi:hypothetical protein
MAQNVEQEGWGVEQQNLNKKLNTERDTERIAGMAETAWEKAVVGKKTETTKTMAQTAKRMAETWKRTVKMWKRTVKMQKTAEGTRKTAEGTRKTAEGTRKTAEGTRKTAVVNTKMEGESLYQNCHNTHQMNGRTILYTLKKKKLNQEQEQRLVY